MINQRLYTNVKLGNSNYTIATDGCYLCSIHQGLKLAGYNFTIQELNQLFKDKGVFAAGSGLLSSATIAAKVGNIFLEGRNEAWNDAKIVQYLKDPNYFVVGEVSGKGIGGQYQHFVKIDRVDLNQNGTINMTFIDDPWDGLEDQKVTTRYNAYGNILSLRVFKIVKGNTNMADMYPSKAPNLDLNNKDSMKVAVDAWVRLVNGDLVDKSKMEAELANQKNLLEAEKTKAVQEAKTQAARAQSEALAEQKTKLQAQFDVDCDKACKEAVKLAKAQWEAEQPEPSPTPTPTIPDYITAAAKRDYTKYEQFSFLWYALFGTTPTLKGKNV